MNILQNAWACLKKKFKTLSFSYLFSMVNSGLVA